MRNNLVFYGIHDRQAASDQDAVVQLEWRSMRNNLVFYSIHDSQAAIDRPRRGGSAGVGEYEKHAGVLQLPRKASCDRLRRGGSAGVGEIEVLSSNGSVEISRVYANSE